MLDHALAHAAEGWPVFPCWSRQGPHPDHKPKSPHVKHWQTVATRDEATIRQWWAQWPDAMIGIAIPEGLAVVDVDPRNGGSLDALPPLPATRIAKSGGGGWHIWFQLDPALVLPGKLKVFGDGFDGKNGGRGYLIAPGSIHPDTGVPYEWENDAPIAPAPEWLTAVARPRVTAETVAADLDESERTQPDHAISTLVHLIAPFYVDGQKHHVAKNLGGWLKQRGWSAADVAAVVGQLPSRDPAGRVRAALAAFGIGTAFGWGELCEAVGEANMRAIDAWCPNPSRDFAAVVEQVSAELAPQRVQTPDPVWDTIAASRDGTERNSDLGNARRLVRLHGAELRYCPSRRLWLVWTGRLWAPDETGEVVRRAKDSASRLWEHVKYAEDRKSASAWALQAQNAGRIEAAIKLAATEPGVSVRVAELDSDPWLLNVENGTLDLRTGELRAPDPSLLMTKSCATHYDPGARSDMWDRFIDRTTGGDLELAAYLQRVLGYALFGAWREKAFWFGYGPPDGGKSTLFAAVGRVLGDYHASAAASTWMIQTNNGGNRGDLVRLVGARLVTTSEIRQGARVDEETVKKVTGGDPIVAAAKYESEIEFSPTFALWWFANDPPIIRDDDDAMWSRARVVPFTNPVPKAEQIADLAERLASHTHAPAVLAWLVRGCLEWQGRGIGTCSAVEAATQRYRGEMNRLAGFAEECLRITRDPADEVSCRALRAAYDQWCRENGVRAPLGPKAFGQRLRALGATGGDDASRHANRSGGIDRHWRGVQLGASLPALPELQPISESPLRGVSRGGFTK